ncbi:alpha-L RNA-binding motif-containing protein [Auricularia subglabra TFB-10046 SS5]|nr:alpha-L RNA-binding motif-containing protein [Auricularia subglabra TFB-10046 SS5]
MRDKNVFSFRAALPRMSWNSKNLYNLWKRSLGMRASEADFMKSGSTLFQQRWLSKKLLRAYHGDYINEKIFKRWYLPSILPDVRDRIKDSTANTLAFANRQADLEKIEKLQRDIDKQAHAPVGSLMWSEVERRMDTVIFRACLTHSVYHAREMVIHGHVKLNGKVHINPNTRLAPGDMVTVNPDAIQMLNGKNTIKSRFRKTGVAPTPITARLPKGAAANPAGSASSSSSQSGEGVTLHDGSSVPDTLRAPRSFKLPAFAAPFIFVPAYLEVSYATCSVVYVRHPTARAGFSEIPTPYDADGEIMRLAWEWYANRRPRIRSKKKLASMPDNRQGQWVFQGIEGRSAS